MSSRWFMIQFSAHCHIPYTVRFKSGKLEHLRSFNTNIKAFSQGFFAIYQEDIN